MGFGEGFRFQGSGRRQGREESSGAVVCGEWVQWVAWDEWVAAVISLTEGDGEEGRGRATQVGSAGVQDGIGKRRGMGSRKRV